MLRPGAELTEPTDPFADLLEVMRHDPLWYVRAFGSAEARAATYGLLRRVHAEDPRRISPHAPGHRVDADTELAYLLVEALLQDGTLALGERPAVDYDGHRRPLIRVVVHETSRPAGTRRSLLEAMTLLRIYVPVHLDPEAWEAAVAGTPVASGHRWAGRRTFSAYTWIIGADGRAERLLDDAAIGWQAGSWPVNCESVGVALEGELLEHDPTPAQEDALAALVSDEYRGLAVIAHSDVQADRSCPGPWFPRWLADRAP